MIESGLTLQPDASRWTLPAFLADVCARHAGRVAIRSEGGELGYAALEREARALARGLVAAGVAKGERVGLLMANRAEWPIAAFGVALVGGVLVPLNTFATPDERDYVLRHADISTLLLQDRLLKRRFAAELAAAHPALAAGPPGRLRCAALPGLRRVFCLEEEAAGGGVASFAALRAAGADVPDALLDALSGEVAPSDDALVIYTSGTTARPKGIVHLQRAPVVQSWRFAEYMGLVPDDRVYTAQPFFWTAGIAMSLGATLAAGATLLLTQHFDAGEALALVERERATAIHAWPHQEKSMAEHPDARTRDLRSARRVEFSSPLAPLVGLTEDRWGTYGAYGLSETFTIASSLPSDAPAELRKATSGRPLPGMEIRIVDPERGTPLATGERGEIAVRGLTLMRGYHKVDPELTFDADGFFRTQDGGYLDAEGYLHWTGRLSNLIKTGGANVSPLEVEAALGQPPGVKSAHALGLPHPTLGEAIVLCVVPTGEAAGVDPESLRSRLRERLAAYKQPRHVLVLDPAEVPYTGSQKVQLAELRERALARLAAEGVEISGHRYGT